MSGFDGFLDSEDHVNEDEFRTREAQVRAERARLRALAPTAEDLTPDYSYEDPYAEGMYSDSPELAYGNSAAMTDALRLMQGEASTTGFTDAERGMMDVTQRRQTQMARGMRDAQMQQAEARGMGGAGLSFMSGQQAGEAATGQQSDYEAQMAMQARMRALQAMQSYGQLGATYNAQTFGQSAHNTGAINAWNQGNTEYRRGVQRDNTDRRNRRADAATGAVQQEYENEYRNTRDAASDTGHYGNAITGETRFQQARDDERMNRILDTGRSAIGGASGGR